MQPVCIQLIITENHGIFLRLKSDLHNMYKVSLLLFFSILLFHAGCKKNEILSPSTAGLIILGDANDIELVALEADPNGGFTVGSNSRTFENKQIRVSSFNNEFRMKWDKFVGGPMSNKLFQLHFNRDQNLVAIGLTYGYGADTLPLSLHKFWWPYISVFDSNGDTLWAKGINGLSVFAGGGSGIDERITRVAQEDNGNYILAGELAYELRIRSTVGRISPSGEFLSAYTAFPNAYGKIDALLVDENRYTSFGYWQEWDTTPAHAGLFKTIAGDTSGSNNFVEQSLGPWPFGSGYDVGIIGTVQHEPVGQKWHVDYIFANACYRYEIDLVSGVISGNYIHFPYSNIQYVKRVGENSIILSDSKGAVYECNNNFEPLHSFKTPWDVRLATKLTNGEFVIATQRGTQIYLVHYSQEGKVIEHE